LILSKSIIERISSASSSVVASVSSLVPVIRMLFTGISRKVTISVESMYSLEK